MKAVSLPIMNNVAYLINIPMRLSFQYVIPLFHMTTSKCGDRLIADINHK